MYLFMFLPMLVYILMIALYKTPFFSTTLVDLIRMIGLVIFYCNSTYLIIVSLVGFSLRKGFDNLSYVKLYILVAISSLMYTAITNFYISDVESEPIFKFLLKFNVIYVSVVFALYFGVYKLVGLIKTI